ncbi:hypothetical protein G9A89_001531 [Geosiphon pyriformis]|nr:hypothetical protein G9A89_001531 [Geosiphon pyriformis]
MCSKFIRFFGGIHDGCTNRVMTDFGLTSGYHVHDGLDQGEIFSPLLWQIFYDPLLCKVKRQESIFLQPIVNYRTQFSFVPPSVYNKWDTMIHKGLKSKSGLPLDFPNDTLHHPSLYGLSTFKQIQTEHKVVSVVCFANSVGILGRLFAHRSHDLQVLCWHSIHPLSSPAHISIGASNNFLVDLVRIFYDCNLFLGGIKANAFCLWKGTPMVSVLGKSRFVKCLLSFWCYGVAFVDQLWNHSRIAFTWATFKHWK